MTVKFNHDDEMLVQQIVGRWRGYLQTRGHQQDDVLHVTMNINAANGVNGNEPLDLAKLIEFDDLNFIHDMAGIDRHMNRDTGLLGDCFLPRCAA